MNLSKSQTVVITLNYNQNQYTLDCIKSLLESNYSNFSIYLIDNGSTQANFEELQNNLPENPKLKLIRINENVGYVGGVNHGIQLAQQNGTDYFLIMNNDTIIESDAISALVNTAQSHKNNVIVSGKVYNYDEKDTLQTIGNAKSTKGPLDFPAYVKNRREKDIGQYDQEMEMGMLDDIFWLIPKLVFDKVGYYSDYFFLYGEQNDYALRAVKANVKLIYTPKAKLWHKEGATTAEGVKESPKIIYWRTFASLKLSVLHLNENESKTFYYNLVIIRTIKKLILIFRGKSSFQVLYAQFLAIKHFNYWKKILYKDNGYNPFN